MVGRKTRLIVGLAVVGCLLSPSSILADEPFWNSKPLSHWMRLLRTGDDAARTTAALGLSEIGLAHGPRVIVPALPDLIDGLNSSSTDLRLGVIAALEQIGTEAGAAITPLLNLFEQDPEAAVRAHAGVALTRIAPADTAVVEGCGRALGRDADARVRQAAAAGLVQAGPAAAVLSAALTRALTDGDAIVRVFAAAAVGQLGQTSLALPVLLAGLTHEDPAVRVEAAGQLAAVAPAHAAVVAPLMTALADRDAQVRLAAADALGQIGRPAQPALQTLLRLIRDPDEAVRESAIRAIRRIRD